MVGYIVAVLPKEDPACIQLKAGLYSKVYDDRSMLNGLHT